MRLTGSGRRDWTREEEQFVIDNYGVMDVNEIARELRRSRSAVINRSHKLRCLGYEMETYGVRRWSEEEEKFLKDNHGTMDVDELEKRLGRSKFAIHYKIYSMRRRGDKLAAGKNRVWTEEEDRYLLSNYGSKSVKKIGKVLGRTTNAVNVRHYVLTITKDIRVERERKYKRWTVEEDEYLIENYPKEDLNTMSEYLDRTVSSIHVRVSQLRSNGVNVEPRRVAAWTDSEDEYIRENYGKLSAKEIARVINRTVPAIYSRAFRLLGDK